MMDKSTRYLSYLLRLWQTDDQGRPVWRASLESPGTHERLGFANLDELFKFLETQTLTPDDQEHTRDLRP
jgi:hypothetical protein